MPMLRLMFLTAEDCITTRDVGAYFYLDHGRKEAERTTGRGLSIALNTLTLGWSLVQMVPKGVKGLD
jgi:hypothetical protein